MARARQIRPSGHYRAATPSSAPLRLAVPLCCRPPAPPRHAVSTHAGLDSSGSATNWRCGGDGTPYQPVGCITTLPSQLAVCCLARFRAPLSLCGPVRMPVLCVRRRNLVATKRHNSAAGRAAQEGAVQQRGVRTTVRMLTHWCVLSARSCSCLRLVFRPLRSPAASSAHPRTAASGPHPRTLQNRWSGECIGSTLDLNERAF